MTDKTENLMDTDETQSEGAEMRSTEEIIGRADVNDLEAILSLIGHQEESGHHNVTDQCEAEFTWDYHKGRLEKLDRLYEKAKTAQWNGRTDLPWETPVDQEAVVMANFATQPDQMGWTDAMLEGTSLAKWSDKEWLQFGVESQNWTLSQFMHGEQGALLCTAKIVETVPWIDAKYYAATQVVDEARHVEVFSRYLDEKLSGHYPLNAHLGLLLDDIIADSRWDMTYLGMQIMDQRMILEEQHRADEANRQPQQPPVAAGRFARLRGTWFHGERVLNYRRRIASHLEAQQPLPAALLPDGTG